jgi:hypothetical protein
MVLHACEAITLVNIMFFWLLVEGARRRGKL